MKFGVFLSIWLSFHTCFGQNAIESNSIAPCNLFMTLFQLELKCGTIENEQYGLTYSCTTDTTRFVSDWIDGKSRPKAGYTIDYTVSNIDASDYFFSDSSLYLTRYDRSQEDSVGIDFLDTASFELTEEIAARYFFADYSHSENRIYIDYSLPIRGNSKSIAVRTERTALLFTITLPNKIKELCIYDQAREEVFQSVMRSILRTGYFSEHSRIYYEIIPFKE